MSLIVCPECKNEISQYAELCPTCGFHIREFMECNNLKNTNNVWICPKCAFYSGGYENVSSSIYIKCKRCNTIVIDTNMTGEEFQKKCFIEHKNGNDFYEEDIAKMLGKPDQFDETSSKQRIAENIRLNSSKESVKNLPKCPTCQSTNIKKMSTTSKAINAGLFGVLGNRRKKQFHCNNCGYEW